MARLTYTVLCLLLLSGVASAREKGSDISYEAAPNAKKVRIQSAKQKKKRKVRRRSVRRTLASRRWRDTPAWKIGLEGGSDGLLGVVSNGLTSAGIGFGGGFHLMGGFARRWQFTLGIGFKSVGLNHTLDGSGVIADPGQATLSQRQNALAARVLIGYYLTPARSGKNKVVWWIDAGAEFLYSLSGSQTGTLPGTTLTYTAPNLLLVRAGPSGSLRLSRAWFLGSSLHLYYNVARSGGASLLGAQLSLALQLAL